MAKKDDLLNPHAQRCEPYNDGHWCFAYDPTHEDRLRRMDAYDALLGVAASAAGEETLEQIGREGLAVAWELAGDHEVKIDVLVDKKLTAGQKKKAQWLDAQAAYLSVPSGRMRIESLNSLAFSPDEPTDEGSEIEIVAGDYDVSLLRVALDLMDEEDLPTEIPTEVLTLTPVRPKGPKKTNASLTIAEALGEDGAWLHGGHVDDGAFLGATRAHSYNKSIVYVNLRGAHAERMGLRFGETARIEAGGVELEVPYIGCLAERGLDSFFGKTWYREHIEGIDYFCGLSPFQGSTPWILEVERRGRQTESALPVDVPATVSLVEPWHDPLEAPLDDVEVSKRQIVGRVVFASDATLILNFGPAALRKAKIEHGDLLRISWDGGERTVYRDAGSQKVVQEGRETFLAEGSPERAELRRDLAEAWERHNTASGRVIALGTEGKDTSEWEKQEAKAREDIDRLEEKLAAVWPSAAHFRSVPFLSRNMTHWERPDEGILWLQPLAGEEHHAPIETGAEVTMAVVAK